MKALDVAIGGRVGSFVIDATFQAEPGVTALFGRSGAGKSTILKMISGMERPESGRIALGDAVLFDAQAGINLPPRKRGIGFVFQEDRLFPHLSVTRNLNYSRWAGGRAITRSFDEVIELLGLHSLLDRMPGKLSGGERQRVAIGRALLADPRILLMDEPLSSLDWSRRSEILPYLEIVAGETRIPIVYVSHDVDEVARLADRVVALEGGAVAAIGSASDILGRFSAEREAALSVIEGNVVSIDPAFDTALVDTGGGQIELYADGLKAGQRLRMSLKASDVAVSLHPLPGVSIRNQLLCRVTEVRLEGHSAEIGLLFAGQKLLARITAKSANELQLAQGQDVVALIKAISVEMGRVVKKPA